MTRPAHAPHARRLSLLQPTGRLTLGNYLGALRPMAAQQDDADCFYGLADLHALTVTHDPATLRAAVSWVSSMARALAKYCVPTAA